MKSIMLIAIGLVLLFVGCSRNAKNIEFFPEKRDVTFEEFLIQGQLAAPGEIKIIDDHIVLFDVYSDFFFHVFSDNDFRSQGTLVRRGRGPGEEVMVFPYFSSPEKGTLMYQNHNSIKFAKLDEKTGGLDMAAFSIIDLPNELSLSGDFFIINDTLYSSIGNPQKAKDFIGFCWETGNVFDRGRQIPAKIDTDSNSARAQLTISLSTIKPDKSLVATIYPDHLFMRIYCTKSWDLKADFFAGSAASNKGTPYLGQYWRVRSNNDYIFALFSNIEPPSIEVVDNRVAYSDVASEIHVWDWCGNPVMKLELDRPIFSFDVTANNKQIIAISIVDPDHLLVADISGII